MSQIIIYNLKDITKKSDDEKKEFINQKCDSAAISIFENLDKGVKKNYSKDKVLNLIKLADVNTDGIITDTEAIIVDNDNIFKLNGSTEEEVIKLQTKIQENQSLDGLKGLEKAFLAPDIAWYGTWVSPSVKDKYVLPNLNKEDFVDMLKNPTVMNYYETEVRECKNCAKRMKEIFEALDISENEIKQIGFSQEALTEILHA